MEAIFVFTNLDVVLVTSLASQEQNGNARHDAGKETVQNATFVHVLGISINQTARAAVSTSLKNARKNCFMTMPRRKHQTVLTYAGFAIVSAAAESMFPIAARHLGV